MLFKTRVAFGVNTSPQEGSDSVDCILGAVALNKGSVILVGKTDGDFVWTSQGSYDFAAIELDTNGNALWRWQVMRSSTWTVFSATSPKNEIK